MPIICDISTKFEVDLPHMAKVAEQTQFRFTDKQRDGQGETNTSLFKFIWCGGHDIFDGAVAKYCSMLPIN